MEDERNVSNCIIHVLGQLDVRRRHACAGLLKSGHHLGRRVAAESDKRQQVRFVIQRRGVIQALQPGLQALKGAGVHVQKLGQVDSQQISGFQGAGRAVHWVSAKMLRRRAAAWLSRSERRRSTARAMSSGDWPGPAVMLKVVGAL